LRLHNYYDFDERFFDSPIPMFRRWYYETIVPFSPENAGFMFAGPDILTLEKALGIPEKIINLNGNYAVSFNTIESIEDVPANYSGIPQTTLSMEVIEDFGIPISISIAKNNNRVTFLNNLLSSLNSLSSNKEYSGSFVGNRIRITYIDKIPLEDQVPGRAPTGKGSVAFKFSLNSPMGTALGFRTSNPNELIYSFNILYSNNTVDVSGLGEIVPVQEPEGLYIKAITKDGFQVLVTISQGFEPLQTLLDPVGQNACIAQDEDHLYVCYLVSRKTLSAFTTFHVKRLFKSSLLVVWEDEFVLPDADINKLFPRLLHIEDEVHLYYGRNDDRIYARVFESLSGLQRNGKVCDLGIKMCYPDKRELKVVRSLQSLDDTFYVYLSFPDGTSPFGSRIALAKYLSSSYSLTENNGHWKQLYGTGNSVKTNLIVKEDPRNQEIFISFTNTPSSGPVTIQGLCIQPNKTLRYTIPDIADLTNLVQNRILGMYVFDECLVFFGLTNIGQVIGYKARTTDGSQVDNTVITNLGFDVSDLQTKPYFVYMVTPWDRVVIGTITLVQKETDIFVNKTIKFDFLESPSQGGITITDTEVSQFQAHLDKDDNIYSVTYVGGKEGLNLTKFDTDGKPVVQRTLSISGQSPAITGDDTGLYASYTLSVDTFVKYLGVYVVKLRSEDLTDIWSYTRLYEEESPTPFQTRIRVFRDRIYTVYVNNQDELLIQVNRARTGQFVNVFFTGINIGSLDPKEITIEPQNDRLLYIALPVNNSIRIIKYNIRDGCCVWDRSIESSIPGSKSGIILRYNPQLQNDFFAFDYDLNEVLSKDEMRDYLESVGIEDKTEEIWDQFGLNKSLSKTQMANYLETNDIEDDVDQIWIDFGLTEDQGLSKSQMNEYLQSNDIDDNVERIWEFYSLNDVDGLVYDQFAEYMYSESFRFINRNGMYLVYSSNSSKVRMVKMNQLGGEIDWSIDTEMDTLYGGRAHAFYITNDVPLVMGVDDTTADLVANKYEPTEGTLISSRRKHLITFDKDLFTNYPHIFSREIWDCIWMVYPNPSIFYAAQPGNPNAEKYQNWVTLVNKALALPIPEPSETFVKLSDKQAMNDCDDCLYVTYVTEEGPNNVTLSKLTYDGVTQFVKELDFGGQSPSVHVVGDKAVVAYVKKLVTFTEIVGLYVLCVRTDNFETVWKSERLLNDSFVDYFKPRVQKSDKGIHVAYFRQDGCMYIDTYEIDTGVLVGVPFCVTQIRTPELPPTTANLAIIGNYVDELDVHSSECLFYAAIPDSDLGVNIKFLRVDALTMADPLTPTELIFFETELGNSAVKRSIQLETSKGDLYESVEQLTIGYTENNSVVKIAQISENFSQTPNWITQLSTDLDQVYLKQMHAMYVDGEITIVFFVRKQGSKIDVVSVKVDTYGNQIEEHLTQGPTNRTILYDKVPIPSVYTRTGDIATITASLPHKLYEGAPVVLSDTTIDTTTFTWSVSSSVANNWSSVAWSPELSRFVAVSTNGTNRVLYSSNGISWTSPTTPPPSSTWRSVVWSPQKEMFVAVGTDSAMYSMDGINWQTGSQAVPDGNWTSVIWVDELGLFVSVADDGLSRAMRSTDGISWVVSREAPPESGWQSVAWSPSLKRLVAFANSGEDRSMISDNGITWFAMLAGAERTWRSVTWSPYLSRFVAVADGGSGRIEYSNNAITWLEAEPSGVINQSWKSVIWADQLNRFIAVGPNVAAQSFDGITWSNISPTILSGAWNSLIWVSSLDRFVVVGTNSIIRRQDGAPLTNKEHATILTNTFEWYMASTSSNNWRTVTWSPELSMFVTISDNGSNRSLYSFDGLTWFFSNTPPPASSWRSVIWSPQRGMFVAVGTDDAMYSMDGIHWQTGSQPVPVGRWTSVTWSPQQGLFVAVADVGTNRAMYSIDGIVWVLSTNAPPESTWQTVVWSSERNIFLALARTGTARAIISSDANTWTTVSIGAARNWMSVTWSPNLARFVAVADGGTNRIAYSNNGTSWVSSGPNTSITDQAWKSVIWVAQLNRFIAVGPNVAAQSFDGITWSTMSPAILSGAWNSTFWSPSLERLVTVGTNAIMFSGLGILSFQVKDVISGSASGSAIALNRYNFTVEELFNSEPLPQVELDVDHGVDSNTIEGYPYVISRAPWDFAFVEYYNTSRIQVLQQDFKKRLAIVGLESPGETRNGIMTSFIYSQDQIPESEMSSYQMVATQNGDTFLAFNDASGLHLTRIRPDGSSFGTRTTILIDQYGQSPTITCFQKVEETEVYEAIMVSYVRRQTGFTSMTVRINLQYRADTMQCIETDNCKPSEYYFIDPLTTAFRPRVDISADKIYVVYKRQDNRLYIDKLDRESNQYEMMKQIREDFSGVDSLGIQVRTYDENFSILYPTSSNTFVRRFTTDLDELWLKQFEVTHKARIEEEEEGIFLAYKDDLSRFKVCQIAKEDGQTDWTTILDLPPIKGEQIHSLFVLFGYPLVFNTSTSGEMVVNKLFPNGDLASQRSTILPSLNTSDIINCPVILTAPPHKTVTLGYYTAQSGANIIPTISDNGIVVQFYTGPIDFNFPLPKGDTTTNQFIQFVNEILQVHTDEPNRLMISRHNITTGDIIATRLVEDEGGYPIHPIIKMGEDDILYLSYIKYEIVYTEIVELVLRAFDPVTLEPVELSNDSLKYPVRRALPDPSPDTFRPRIYILNNELVRTYVRLFDKQINIERLNLVNFFLQRPQRLGIVYDGGRNPDNIHYHREGSNRLLFIYPVTQAEDLYRVSKINPTTHDAIWSVDMDLSSAGVGKENPDLRFDEEFNVYYMSMSSSNKGFLTKFRDNNGNVLWTKPFEVNSYRFDGVAPETSFGDNIEFDIPFGTDLQFIVNTPGSPMVFRRKSTMEILGDGVSPGQTLSNGRIVAPTQGVISFRSGFLAPGEYLYASAFDSKMTGRIFIQPPVQDTFVWNIVKSGGSFTVSNNGVSGTNLDINVIRKDILEFNITSIGDPVWIVARIGGVDFDVIDGIENNGIESGVIRLDTSLISSSVDYYYVTKSTPKIEGRIILTPLSLSTITWNVTISDFRPRYYNQGMAIFEHFPLIFTVPGYNAMMVHKFSDLGVLLSNKITRLSDFQYTQVAPGCSTYSASLYPWRKSLIFHDTDDIPALSYNANRRRAARTFDSGVFNVIAPITANIRTSQGAQDSRKTAVATFYQVDPPGWASGVSVYFFQGRRPNDLCRRLVSGMDSGMGFQPSLSKLNGEDVFYLTYIRAIETFTEVQYLNMHAISADVMLQDLWVMEEQRFIDGRWQHFRPLIKIYEEVVVIVYIRQNRRLVVETRSKENGELIQRLTTTYEVPDPEEMVIGGDFDLMVGFPNGDHTITLIQFQISDLRAGIQEVWSAPFISDFGEAFRQKRSLEITQNVSQNLVAAFLSSDFIPMDEPEDITLITAIDMLQTDEEGEFIPFTQTFYDTVDQRLLESRIDLFKTLDYISDSRIHGRSIVMIAALRGDDFLFNLIFTDAAQGMTEQNFGRHMWFFKNFGIKIEYVDRLESLPIVERKIGLDLPREQYLYIASIERDTQELLWTQRAQTSNFTGVFENTERISGITYDGAFVGVTRIGRTLVDNNPFTIDAFTYSINSTGSRIREIQDRFDENQPPSYSGTPLFMLDMADEFGIMAVIIPGGEFKMYRVFSTGGSIRVPFDGDGRAIHPAYRGEDWWRPFITINPVIQGTSLEEDIILNIKDADWTSVVWTGNNFVALGPSTQLERVMVSSTGKSWTGVELDDEFDKQWVDAVWAQGALNLEPYVIVALAETEDGNSIMTTTDAINWTLQETPVQNVSWSSLVWDNQLFVAVGKGGSGKRVMVSGLKGFSKDERFFTITSVNSSFVVSGEVSGTNETIRVNRNELVNLTINSPDSRVWLSKTLSPGLEDALISGLSDNGVIGNGQIIVFDTEIVAPGTYYYISEENPTTAIGFIIVDDIVLNKIDSDAIAGVDWEIEDVSLFGNLNSSGWRSVAWSPKLKRFVAVAFDGSTRIMVSYDGCNWIVPALLPTGINTTSWTKVIWATTQNNGDGYFVAVANTGQNIAYSTDGDVWFTRTASQLSGMNLSSIAWSRVLNMFVVVSTNGDDRIATSIDLRHWVKRGNSTEKAIFDELVSRIFPTTNFITVPEMRRVLRELHFNIYEPSNVNTGAATWLSTTIDKFELPYMAYRDSSTSKINVRRYNGNAWVSMGTDISAGDVSHVSIKTDSQGGIIIAYRDSANGNRLSVRRYNGTSWATLGTLGFSAGQVEFVNLLVNSADKIYVIYRDNSIGGGRLVGRVFENNNWLVMGDGPVSTGVVSNVSAVINSIDQIFVAFSNKVVYTNPNVEFDELVVYQYSEVSEAWAPSSTNLTRELSGTFVKSGNLVTVSTTVPNPNPPPADIPSSHGLLRGSIVIIRNSSTGLSNGLYIVHSTTETSFTIVDSVSGNTSGTTTVVNVGGVTATMLQVQLSASYSRTDNAVTLTFPRPHGIFPGTLVNIPNLTTGLINRTYTVVEVPTPETLVVTETSPGNASGSVNVTYPGGSRRMEAGLVNLVVNPRLNPVDVPIDGVFDKYLAYQQRFIDVNESERFLVFVKKNTDASAWFDTETSIVLSDTVQEMKMTGDPYGNLFLIVKEPLSYSVPPSGNNPGVETPFSERLTIYSYKPNTNWVKPVDRRGFTAGKVSNITIVATVNSPDDISDTTRLFITFSDATRGNKPTMISFYPITLQNTVVAIENMIRDAANLENDDINYVDFSNLNYSPPKNNWSSVIWSDGAIGPTETGSFMAVSSNSSVDNNVIVYNIPTDMDERVFRNLFTKYGVIQYSAIFRDRATGSPLGYGIIRFSTLLSAENASKSANAGGMNGALVKGRELTGVLSLERGVADRAIRSVTGLTWPVSKTIRDVGAGSYKGWFANGQLKFEKRYAIEGPITGLERNYSSNGQWSKEIGHTGISNTREFIVPTRMNLYELFRRFFVRRPVGDQELFDDETIDKEDLLCGIRSFNLNIPRLPEGSSPLDKLFQRMGPNQDGRVDFKGFSRVVATDQYTRDIVNKIGFDRAILTRDAQTIDGLKDGILTEYESSLPAFMEIRTASFIKDVQNGPEMRYYSDSSLRSQVNFVNGLRVGEYIEYLPREFGILKPKLILEYDNKGYETQFKTTFYSVVNAESLVESRIVRFSDPRNSNIQVLMETYWRTAPGDPIVITNGVAARSYPNNWVELVDGSNVTRVTISPGTYETIDDIYTAIKNALNANSTRNFDYNLNTSTLRVSWSYSEGTGTVAFRFGTVSSDVLAPTKGGLNEIMGFRVSNQEFQFSFVNKFLSGPLAVINSPLRETIAPVRLRTRCFLTNLRAKLGPLEEYTKDGQLIQRGMYDNNLKVGRWETIFERPRTLMVRNAKRTLENYSKGKLSGANALQVFNEAGDRIFTKNFPVAI
jgi:RNA recognition motif-containing protein/Ca2+-binding EF-hand superfamily protein